MTFEVMLREAFMNVVAAPLRSLLLIGAAFLAAAGVVSVSAVDLGSIASREQAMVDSGIYVYRVQTVSPVPAILCDRLRFDNGILDSGALLSRQQGTLRDLPGASVQRIVATTGYLRIGWADSTAGLNGSTAGSGLLSAFGFRAGTRTTFTDTVGRQAPITIDLAARPTERLPGANFFIASPSLPLGDTRECLVEADPHAMEAVATYLVTTFGPDTVITPLAQPRESTEDLLHQRLSLWTPIVVPAAVALFFVLGQYGRRADLALYRLLGTTRSKLFLLTYLEAGITLIAPFAAGLVASVLIFNAVEPMTALVVPYLANDAVRSWLLMLIAAVPMSIAPARSTALAWLKGQ